MFIGFVKNLIKRIIWSPSKVELIQRDHETVSKAEVVINTPLRDLVLAQPGCGQVSEAAAATVVGVVVLVAVVGG